MNDTTRNNPFEGGAAIRPSSEEPAYWSIGGRPALLAGGSREDNLFQIEDLETSLDLLADCGGNYIRNTMSDRDPGDARAFVRIEEGPDAGLYDLDRWNPEYWERFERLLRLCRDRGIVVQIEVWDRFDHSREPWRTDPWNPANNVNYTEEQSGLATEYPEHPAKNLQPFFHTVPSMDDNRELLPRQERFVEKLLSISFRYPNVLYCMNNETHESPEWGQYWLRFIRERAAEAGVEAWATDMFDGNWQETVPEATRRQFEDPDAYPFIDVSQVNAWRCSAQRHFENLKLLSELNQRGGKPRPLNNVKVYNSDTLSDRSGPRKTDRDGIQAFWMNLLGGCASARFHRPPHGLGLSEKAQASLRTVRFVEQRVAFWRLRPEFGYTGGRAPAEVVLARQPGGPAVLLLPLGGSALYGAPLEAGERRLTWIELETGKAAPAETRALAPGDALEAPGDGVWLLLLEPAAS